MTGPVPAPGTAIEWAPCYCCARSYPAADMVAFDQHPGDHLCVPCLRWLCEQARPVIRVPLQFKIRGRAARLLPRAAWQGRSEAGAASGS